MTSIYSGINAASSASTTNTDKVGKGMGAMDANDFLKLLTTQLTQQDPTQPMDNSQMLAQMAQFTSLEQMTNMNATLERLSTMNRTAAIGLMGHEVIYGGSDGRLTSGKVVGVRFDAGKIFVAVGEDETLLENIVAVSS